MRSRLLDDIQRLHGTMPLWGVDRWVSLGDLFVDVNILELISSNRRSELDDLWRDFTLNNSDYRSLDRIGLGGEQQRLSGLAMLERNTNLMVVGKPGSGKTTYLQRIVTECNDGKLKANRIPVLIKLREFVDDGRKYAYNLEKFLEHQWWLSNTNIELILKQGFALVLLDGLDEVAGEARKQITQQIKRFVRSYPQVQVIVSCRTQSQESKFDRFDYVEVADFNEKQARAFATHWFETVCRDTEEGKTKTQEFLSQLFRAENKPIRELAITPILLSLTCAVFQQTGKFYSKRSKLYEEGLELLLEQWDKSREVERDEIYRDLSVERKLELLSYVAVKKFEQEQYVLFEQTELEGYIGVFLGIEKKSSCLGILRAIEAQHGLLIERARQIWSFSHLTFQEHFTAIWFSDEMNWQNLVNHIMEVRWQEIFFRVIELISSTDEFLLLIKNNIDVFLASDIKLQNFLTWAFRKATTVSSPYKPAAVRAFYCQSRFPENNNINYFDDIKDNWLSTPNFNYKLDIDIFFDIALMKFLNSTSDRKFFFSFELACSIDSWFKSVRFRTELIHRVNDNDGEDFLNTAYNLAPTLKLKSILDRLKNEEFDYSVPYYSHRNFKSELIGWIIYVATMERNIGHNWQFSEEEKSKLNQYYYANQLLLKCLNSNCSVKNNTRQEIEETLLLPIAEIEKRKQSNS